MPLRVLIVEDEFLIALDTQGQLEQRGYSVVGVAPSITAALKCIAEQTIDVAVLDVNLRGEHVRPVAQLLRRQGVPFIYITAYQSMLTDADGIEEAPILGKPYSADELHGTLSGIVGNRAC